MSVVVYELREVLLTDRGETRLRPASVAVGSKAQPGRESGTNRGTTGVGTCRTVSLNAPMFGSHLYPRCCSAACLVLPVGGRSIPIHALTSIKPNETVKNGRQTHPLEADARS